MSVVIVAYGDLGVPVVQALHSKHGGLVLGFGSAAEAESYINAYAARGVETLAVLAGTTDHEYKCFCDDGYKVALRLLEKHVPVVVVSPRILDGEYREIDQITATGSTPADTLAGWILDFYQRAYAKA